MSYTTFFYDHQIRRFLSQFIRIMSNFQVQLGNDEQGGAVYQRVPVFYGDASRQASQILRSNSENAISAVPAMAVHISALTYDRERVQEPNFVSKMNIRTRQFDESTGQYTDQQGGAYTVERLMPVPYKLSLKVDVWTSNTDQKLMLLEQIMILFNPAMEIQSTDNYIDWTSLSYVLLNDIGWSNRSVPMGTEDSIDIATLTFELPIWISAPAKVKQLGVIKKIISSIYDANGNLIDVSGYSKLANLTLTFENFAVVFQGNTLKLLKRNDIIGIESKATLELELRMRHSWQALITLYGGALQNGLSQVRLLQSNGSDLVGTVAYHPTDDTLLLYTPDVDTMPANTMSAITAIINPQNIDVDMYLANPATGTRYLLLHGVGSQGDTELAPAWNTAGQKALVANANDIVEYNGIHWTVAFDSQTEGAVSYVTNMTTGIQYKWQNNSWSKSVEGRYDGTNWSLRL